MLTSQRIACDPKHGIDLNSLGGYAQVCALNYPRCSRCRHFYDHGRSGELWREISPEFCANSRSILWQYGVCTGIPDEPIIVRRDSSAEACDEFEPRD